MARRDPLPDELEESVTEGIIAVQRHVAAHDRPVHRGETFRLTQVERAAIEVAPVAEYNSNTTVQAGTLIIVVRQNEVSTHRFVIEVSLASGHPTTQQVVVHTRVDLAELAEPVVTHRRVGRPHDSTLLVDPHRGGHIREAEQLGNDVLPVDENREGQPFLRGPLPDRVLVGVERNGDERETVITQFLVQRLPDRQLPATASPAAPCEQQALSPIEVAERYGGSRDVGQGEVGCLERTEHFGSG